MSDYEVHQPLIPQDGSLPITPDQETSGADHTQTPNPTEESTTVVFSGKEGEIAKTNENNQAEAAKPPGKTSITEHGLTT